MLEEEKMQIEQYSKQEMEQVMLQLYFINKNILLKNLKLFIK